MKMKLGIAAPIAALVLGGLTACGGGSGAYYDTICVDPITQIRQPDFACGSHPAWVYYVPYGYVSPGYGVHITNYTVNNYHRPTNATVHTGGVPASGGKASKFSSGNVSLNKDGNVKPKSRTGGSTGGQTNRGRTTGKTGGGTSRTGGGSRGSGRK